MMPLPPQWVPWPTLQANMAGRHALILGDAMLDRYIMGRAERLSPEAPVPVVAVEAEDARPGGAANVALNLAALGLRPHLLATVGDDPAAQTLAHTLHQAGIRATLVPLPGRPTTTKTRILARDQHLLRLDQEDDRDLTPDQARPLLNHLTDAWAPQAPAALLLQDYNKGVLTPPVIRAAITMARQRNVPTLVDPKHRHLAAYAGATWLKPNRHELETALDQPLHTATPGQVAQAVATFRNLLPHTHSLVTLAEGGMLWQGPDGPAAHWPAHLRRVRDVSGAGDAVVATLAAALVAGAPPAQAVALANLAGGLVCEIPGVAPVPAPRLWEEAQRLNLGPGTTP